MWKPEPFDIRAHMIRKEEQMAHEAALEQQRVVEQKRDSRGPFWLRFHVWFWFLSVMYWLVSLSANPGLGGYWAPSVNGAGNVFGNALGLFVPLGPNNSIFFNVSPLGWVALALIILVVWRGNRVLERFKPKRWEKVFYNLFTLLALTFITDLLTLMNWASLKVLLDSLKSLWG